MIVHCMTISNWHQIKEQAFWGASQIEKDGFIHFSTIDSFKIVAPHFKSVQEPLVLLGYDEDKLVADVVFEDLENCGTKFPHVYGLINNDALIEVIPLLKDGNGEFMLDKISADMSYSIESQRLSKEQYIDFLTNTARILPPLSVSVGGEMNCLSVQ